MCLAWERESGEVVELFYVSFVGIYVVLLYCGYQLPHILIALLDSTNLECCSDGSRQVKLPSLKSIPHFQDIEEVVEEIWAI